MDYKMLYRIYNTIIDYYKINEDVLTEEEIKNLKKQADTICDEMKKETNNCFYKKNCICGGCLECYQFKCPVVTKQMTEEEKKFYGVIEIENPRETNSKLERCI